MQLAATGGEDADVSSLQDRLRSRDKLYEQAVEVVVRELDLRPPASWPPATIRTRRTRSTDSASDASRPAIRAAR